jgi:tRNA threonylcarbamoyladenosine biosynthesis protein TsaE
MAPMRTVVTRSEEETAAAGRELAEALGAGSVVLLIGQLGAGKTAFVRGLAEGLGIDPGEVSSPTFTLIQEYAGRTKLYHVDLYRLEPREVPDLGLEELAEEGVMAVEWADRLPARFGDAIGVTITDRGGETREIVVSRQSVVGSR